MLGTDVDKVAFDGSYVFVDEDEEEEKKVSLEQVALKGTFFNNIELQVVKQHSSPLSPPRLWLAWQKLRWIRRQVR